MSKHTRVGRIPFDLDDFSSRVVQDLEAFLPDSIVASRGHAALYKASSSWLDHADMQVESPTTVAAVRQVQAIFHKNPDMPLSSEKERTEAAHLAFLASEKKCRIVNKRLRFYSDKWTRQPKFWSIINDARSIIADCLGPLNVKTFHKCLSNCGFGPGTTYGATHPEHRHLYYKLDGPHTVTSAALPYLKVALTRYFPHWREELQRQEYTIVDGNRVTYVPKTFKIKRTIAVEPSLNTFLLKGVEHVMTGCLRRRGINLREQEPNQDLAYFGSCSGKVATVDLSAASDSISFELVKLMLPTDWFILLDDLRSSHYTLDKGQTWHEYAKFSSMGNACTFPLETLIFWAVAKACVRFCRSDVRKLRVYGDDVIIPTECFCILTEVYAHLGFSLNTDKSFAFGPFRESCGADYHFGVDVRPVYVKGNPKKDCELYNLYNRLLTHRHSFRFPNSLSYLYNLARLKAHGPENSLASLEDPDWYAGKNRVYDSYFFAPARAADRRSWDPDTHSYVYRSRGIVRRQIKAPQSRYNDSVRYLCFLLGITEGLIHYVCRPREYSASLRHRWWPEMQWEPPHYRMKFPIV